MKYFGTDGIRGIVGEKLNEKVFTKIGKALVRLYRTHNFKPVLLVGNDSRISSDYILTSIAKTLLKHGIEVHNLGVCSSPALAYVGSRFNYPLSMMISASHNPSEYNGIKFFNALGEKISVDSECEIERIMDTSHESNEKIYAVIKDVHMLLNTYVSHLTHIKKSSEMCIIDCANGGASEIAKLVFPNCKKINAQPNGYNINRNAGCTNIELIKRECINQHMIGISLDGDADRLHMVSESGTVISGDKILYILSIYYLNAGDKLVGTIYTNSAFERVLKKRKITLVRADVGDKKVYQKMQELSATLGGEKAGHIIMKKYANTGDGILIAILVLNILKSCKIKLDEIASEYTDDYQLLENIKLDDTFDEEIIPHDLIEQYTKEGLRIIIRPSGTEPLLRVMVEGTDEKKVKNCLNLLKNHIKSVEK